MKLTQVVLDRGKPTLPKGKSEGIFFDDELPGFGLRVREGGARVFVVQYKLGAKQRRMTLGSTRELKLSQARNRAKDVLAKVHQGQDPQGERAQARVTAAETFKAVAGRFLAFKEKQVENGKLRASSLSVTTLYLTKHCKVLNELRLDKITNRDIALCLSTIAEKSGAVSADRARSALSALFSWAMKEGLCDDNPVIATNQYAGDIARDRVLSDEELAALWLTLPEGDYGDIVKLLILTGCRSDEIAWMRWPEIEDDILTIPSERSKNHRAHDVPLSAAAKNILAARWNDPDRDEDRELVFGKRAGGFQGWSKAKAKLDPNLNFKTPWQLRDLRRTTATGMADLGVQPHIVEAALNHASGHKAGVAGIYNRATYAKEKREALDAWANHVAVLVAQAEGANVHRLQRA
jgi:integrase